MLALAPETVDLGTMARNRSWYTETAPRATAARGEEGVALILDHLRRVIGV